VNTVFVIINEWTDIAGNTSSEVVGGSFFETESDAWEALAVIAESFGDTLLPQETAITFEGNIHNLQTDEYYIEELTRG
jgi:hypothetical protein